MVWETLRVDTAVDTEPTDRGVGDLVRRWYSPIGGREAWVASGYLLASTLASAVWFVVAVVVLALMLPMTILVVTIPVAVALSSVFAQLAVGERRRARWLGIVIEAPHPPAGRPSWLARLRDPVRWRAIGYFVAGPVVYSVFLACVLVGWGAPLYLVSFPVWGWAVGVGTFGLVVSVLAGVALAGVGPRSAVLFARLGARYSAWLLGRDRVEAMQERVDELAANREEILSAVASERRRIERNLHDGVQQHLVAVGIDLGLAASKVDSDPDAARELLQAASDKNRASIGELRSIGRGLHPAVLDDRGLDAALSAVVAGSPVPISLDVQPGLEIPLDTAETAYFVVAEAVTNIVKHAKARTGSVHIIDEASALRIRVHDDGRGGADLGGGSGLAGIAARVRGNDGTFSLSSPPGGPTTIDIELPHDG